MVIDQHFGFCDELVSRSWESCARCFKTGVTVADRVPLKIFIVSENVLVQTNYFSLLSYTLCFQI